MKKIILLNKKEGETPLEALEVFRLKNKEYKDSKMTYAGRLDPMASGLLLILAGDKVKDKEKYLGLDKEYEFEILFGLSTDTHDILGKVTNSKFGAGSRIEDIKKELKFLKGKVKQKIPLYSTKTWERTRKGEVVQEEERIVEIKNLSFLGMRKISAKKLLQNIEKRVGKVKGDFRQKEILKVWAKILEQNQGDFYVGKFKTKCSSGTYVRSIAYELGERIDIPALAFSIKRVKIGRWRASLIQNTKS